MEERVFDLHIDLNGNDPFEFKTHFFELSKNENGSGYFQFISIIGPFLVNGFGEAKNAYGDADRFGQGDRLAFLKGKRLVIFLDLDRYAANSKVAKHQEFDPSILST